MDYLAAKVFCIPAKWVVLRRRTALHGLTLQVNLQSKQHPRLGRQINGRVWDHTVTGGLLVICSTRFTIS